MAIFAPPTIRAAAMHCDVDLPARYVAVMSKNGAVVHEATLYKTEADVDKAGITAKLVPGSHPWGSGQEGF